MVGILLVFLDGDWTAHPVASMAAAAAWSYEAKNRGALHTPPKPDSIIPYIGTPKQGPILLGTQNPKL